MGGGLGGVGGGGGRRQGRGGGGQRNRKVPSHAVGTARKEGVMSKKEECSTVCTWDSNRRLGVCGGGGGGGMGGGAEMSKTREGSTACT